MIPGNEGGPARETAAIKAQALLANQVERLGMLVGRLGERLAPYGDDRPSTNPTEKALPGEVSYWPPYFQETREQLARMERSMSMLEELLAGLEL